MVSLSRIKQSQFLQVPSWFTTNLISRSRLIVSTYKAEYQARRGLSQIRTTLAGKATQVQPPLGELDLVSVFLFTLTSPFYEHLIKLATTNFVALIQEGERIEDGLKTGRIFNHDKLKFWIEQSLSKKYEEWTTPVASHKNKTVHTIEFLVKSKRREKKEIRD